jgi:EF hand
MNRIVLGAVAALLLVGAGLFWWQGRAETERGAPPPGPAIGAPSDQPLPFADGSGMRGAAPPQVDEVTREQRRFDRLDHNRDGRITANEMLAPRAAAFRKLDVDHNNLLSFQEWAVRTSSRFGGADANRDGALTREEFVTTKPKRGKQPACRCSPLPRPAARRGVAPPPEPSGGDEGGEPEL